MTSPLRRAVIAGTSVAGLALVAVAALTLRTSAPTPATVTCDQPPLFALGGPDCVAEDVPCRCSECFLWDPSPVDADHPPAEWYEVQRDGVTVGDTRWRNRWICDSCGDEDCATCLAGHWDRATFWCVAWDDEAGLVEFPHRGVTYSYAVRGCRSDSSGVTRCADGWSPAVRYTAAPYFCAINPGGEVECWPGAGLWGRR